MTTWGIDISKWQGDFDLKNSGAGFVIIKAGGSDDGMYIDSQFYNNYTKAKNLGIPCGIYWYTRAVSVTNLDAEIDYLISWIECLQFELPIFLDLEEEILYNKAPQLAIEWINRLSSKGYYAGIYTSWSWWNGTLKGVVKSILPEQRWLALWINGNNPEWDCGIWQNGYVTINGGEIDSDYLFADYSFIKKNGLNGYSKMEKIFDDVSEDKSYYKAVKWAKKKGIIKGYSDNTFRPDEPCTRAQIVTMMWREAGKPEV